MLFCDALPKQMSYDPPDDGWWRGFGSMMLGMDALGFCHGRWWRKQSCTGFPQLWKWSCNESKRLLGWWTNNVQAQFFGKFGLIWKKCKSVILREWSSVWTKWFRVLDGCKWWFKNAEKMVKSNGQGLVLWSFWNRFCKWPKCALFSMNEVLGLSCVRGSPKWGMDGEIANARFSLLEAFDRKWKMHKMQGEVF